MEHHPATLGGLLGEGHAIVRRHGQGRVSCDGVFSTVDPNASRQLRGPEDVRFEGVVYSGENERRLSMRVLVHSTQTRQGRTTSFFVSRGDPLEDEAQG